MDIHSLFSGPEPEAPSLRGLQKLFRSCDDFQVRELDYGLTGRLGVTVCWLDGPVSSEELSAAVLRPLTELSRVGEVFSGPGCLERLERGGVYRCSVMRREDLRDLAEDLCRGCCALLIEGESAALSFEVRTSQLRAVAEPSLEKTLKGAKDSFVENLRVNTALLRLRLATSALKCSELTLGERTKTRVALLYLEGAAPETLPERLRQKLETLELPALLGPGALEQALAACPVSPFPQLLHTERPDRLARYLSEGRIGLLIDGVPLGLVLPVDLGELLRAAGDDSMHWIVASGLRTLRVLAMLVGTFLPAFYVAVARFHQEMIPTRLLLSLIEAERDLPFSTSLELLSMLLAFSLLQEAGLRMPNPIGDTVSIIGALIVGQAAVEARLVSPIAIIVVAVSGICGYCLPSQDLAYALRLTRLLLLLAAIPAGLYGVGLMSCLVLLHLSELESFGAVYTAPLGDGRPFGLLRLLLCLPPPRRRGRGRKP